MKEKIKILLAGNPNCGKTSLFNQLTGTRQHVGNYPGVTVESKSGTFELGDMSIELVDLPGVYSLSSMSPEEKVSFEELIAPGVDFILNVVDSTILQRSLYLTAQLAELHIPMVIALNMSDEAEKLGIHFDINALEHNFGAKIVKTVSTGPNGIRELLNVLSQILPDRKHHAISKLRYGDDVEDAINDIAIKIDQLHIDAYSHLPDRFFAIKLLENQATVSANPDFAPLKKDVWKQLQHLSQSHDIANADTFIADCRHEMIAAAIKGTIIGGNDGVTMTDKIDKFVTNQWLGIPIFLLIMYLTFWFTFTCAQPFMTIIEAGFSWLAGQLGDLWPEATLGTLRSLIIEGVIGGVGGVIVFLPNILFLFLAIAILEDSGYMSRAAFVMDGFMRKFGLQGRSFVPLVLGFGCTVPAIMAARCIESEKDRSATIMVLPLMSCGARLPIYSLIIPAFFAARYQALVMWTIYIIGVLVALLGARLLKGTLFKGEGEVYLMELPTYRIPALRSIGLHMWDRGKMYLQKAATIILATSVILFICNKYPEKTDFSKNYAEMEQQLIAEKGLSDAQIQQLISIGLPHKAIHELQATRRLKDDFIKEFASYQDLTDAQMEALIVAQRLDGAFTSIDNQRSAEMMEYTISGNIGKFLEPIFKPIGFDWKISTALVGALAAKEIFVSQLGILNAVGNVDESSDSLRARMRGTYTPLQAFCIMLFCLLSIPCFATLAVIRRELNSTKMMFAEAAGLFALAYIMTFIVYLLGNLLHIGTSLLG